MDKILNLLHSNDKSNHKLALVLIKSQGLDLYEIVKKIFHNKEFWKLYDHREHSALISLYIDYVDFTIVVHNTTDENNIFVIYNNERHDYFYKSGNSSWKNPSEEQMIQIIVNTLESIM